MNRHLTHYLAAFALAALTLSSISAQTLPEPPFRTAEEQQAARARIVKLAQVQARYEGEILERPGVFGIGIGFDRERAEFIFVVYVDEDRPIPDLPRNLEGVRIVLRREQPPRASHGGACGVPPGPCHNNQVALPVQMGNSGRTNITCGACTMGFKACDVVRFVPVWVTAAHCASDGTTCPGSAPIGTTTMHVSNGDAASCNTPTSTVGTVLLHSAPGVATTTVDATSISSRDDQTQWSIRDIGTPSTAPGWPLPFFPVQKSGRTTGLTAGNIIAVNASVNVLYNCGTVTMTQQFNFVGAANLCQLGDSGSAVLDIEVPPQIVGLHIAGTGTSCWANEIGNVLAELDLSLNPNDCPDVCPAEETAAAAAEPAAAEDLLYALRDGVLGESEYGRRFMRRFHAVAPAWSRLYVRNPRLLAETARSLGDNLDVLRAIVERRLIRVPIGRLQDLDRLLAAHIKKARDPDLRAAFATWRAEIRDRSVQQRFGVTVER